MGLKDNWFETDKLQPKACPRLLEKAISSIAAAVDGLTPENGKDEYLEMVANELSRDHKTLAYGMLSMSGCALTALGLWRTLGVGGSTLWNTYRIGKAVANVVSVARGQKAWVDSIDANSQPFNIGDVVLVASPEHVFTIVSQPVVLEFVEGERLLGSKRFAFLALHGGRKTRNGKQLIEVTKTEATWHRNRLIITGQSKSGIPSSPRAVMGIAKTKDFKLDLTAKLPDGWLDSEPAT